MTAIHQWYSLVQLKMMSRAGEEPRLCRGSRVGWDTHRARDTAGSATDPLWALGLLCIPAATDTESLQGHCLDDMKSQAERNYKK